MESSVVRDIRPGLGESRPGTNGGAIVLGDAITFAADDGQHGVELWRSDGTPEGTALVSDIRPGTRGSILGEPTAMVDALYLTADDGKQGARMWRSDGTAEGTIRLLRFPR